ncbi:hypothetical protein GALL_445200 [mine drainage metagenome]|uniref:Uncharacterized protein n=1 Tax=mine drainage metagenome TaxID=410659 RepID=A0A1J5PQG7_9ZZZZ
MHQRLRGARQKPVIDEEIFFDVELGVAPFQLTGTIVFDAVAQHQVLCPRRGPNRVGLHKTQALDGARQRGRAKQGACHGIAAQGVKGDRHGDRVSVQRTQEAGLCVICASRCCWVV